MKYSKIGILMLGGLLLSSCSNENPWNDEAGEGRIMPVVIADNTVTDVVPQTKADGGLTAPAANQFNLKLAKSDGTYSKTWSSVDLFPTDEGFKVGGYTLEASYGDIDKEGFESPYFWGKSEFVVKESETTNVSVTASLANTMVSIDYTEEFKQFFKNYSAQLHSEGGDFISFVAGETRPAFLKPGRMAITVSLTKQNGVSATFEPAAIDVEAKHHYHITFDVNQGEVGDAQLSIIFDDSVVEDNVVLDLSDEVMLAPAPIVTPSGFLPGQTVTVIEGTKPQNPLKFTATAKAGLKSVTLTTQSDKLFALGMPAEIDLMAATPAQQSLLKQLGFDIKGLWNNPDKLASIDFSDVVAGISGNGQHKFTLVVKDKMTKVNEPISLIVDTQPVELELLSALASVNSPQATVTINYSGDDVKENVTIESLDQYGVWHECAIKNAVELTRAVVSYKLNVEVPADAKEMQIRVKYRGVVKSTGILKRNGVALNVAPENVWAKRAILGVTFPAATNMSDLKFYISKSGGAYEQYTDITVNASAMEVTFNGLSSATDYSIRASETGNYEESYQAVSFRTESELQPQNGGMNDWYQEWAYKGTTVGIGIDIYEWFPKASAIEPTYWSTRNAMTTSQRSGSSNYYTSFSGTIGVSGASGNAAEISTIGWGEGNTFTNTMSGVVIKNKTAGMLFMGDYAYNNGTEIITYGRPFASRPTSLTFQYKFAPINSEQFKAYVVVENRDGGKVTEIARGELVSGETKGTFTQAEISLKYTNKALKATHAYVVFLSSTEASPAVKNVKGSKNAFQGYADSKYIGNVLTVDEIKFIY